MLTAWRIVLARHAAAAFTGEGARRFGGRWNSPGVAMVYGSATLALAALETLLHLNPHLSLSYVVFKIRFREPWLETLPSRALADGWDVEPPGPASMSVGDNWVREKRSVVLAVPSVIVPGELNYLFNPAHPSFKSLRIGQPEPFEFDARLIP